MQLGISASTFDKQIKVAARPRNQILRQPRCESFGAVVVIMPARSANIKTNSPYRYMVESALVKAGALKRACPNLAFVHRGRCDAVAMLDRSIVGSIGTPASFRSEYRSTSWAA
jgi:hypothetical protein